MFVIILIIILLLIATCLYYKLSINICNTSRHLVGKVVIVTGGDSGIGFETALDLADRGARVIIASYNEEGGVAARNEIIARTGNSNVHFEYMNLLSLKSVKLFAHKIISSEQRLDILINNAGALYGGQDKTEDGLAPGMQCNYFGPFLLTNLLLPLLIASAPSRIVNVSSVAHKIGSLNLEDLNMENCNKYFVKYFSYFNAKLCIALMTVELARQLMGTGVTANFLHPGTAATNIVNVDDMLFLRIFVCAFKPFIKTFVKSPRMAAQTSIYLAVSSEVENISGCYFANCRKSQIIKKVQNDDKAKELWSLSKKFVKLE